METLEPDTTKENSTPPQYHPSIQEDRTHGIDRKPQADPPPYASLGITTLGNNDLNERYTGSPHVQPTTSTSSVNPYHSGYNQGRSQTVELNHDPFSGWVVQSPERQENVSDLRLFGAIAILLGGFLGAGALVQAVKAQEELRRGNITRARELNSSALGLGIAGIAVSFFVGAAVVVQQIFL